MSKPRKVNKLSDLSIDEVSLVDRGANQHAQVLIHKRHEEDEVEKADPDPSAVDLDDEEEDEELDEGVVEEKSVGKNFFGRLVEKMFNDGELTTPSKDAGSLRDMSDVDKAFPGQDPRLAAFGGQQPPPVMPPAQTPGVPTQGMPAPGPQGAMPPGPQGFPAAQQPMPGQMQAGPPLPDEVVQYIQQLEQALADAQGKDTPSPSGDQEDENVNPFGKSIDNLDADETEFLQELAKNLEDEDTREAVNKALEAVSKANERAEQAETIAKAERDHRLNQEYIAKARAFVNLPVSAEEFGPVLKKLHETLTEDEAEVITKALNAANETIANAGLFTEIGKRSTGENYETVSKVDALAKERVEKSDGLSLEQAKMQVFEENPGLYDEYLQESGR